MNSIRTVIKFTFLNRFRSKAFFIITAIIAVVITIGVNLPVIIEKFSTDDPVRVGVVQEGVSNAVMLSDYFKANPGSNISIVLFSKGANVQQNDGYLQSEMDAGKIDGYLYYKSEYQVVYKSENPLELGLKERLQAAMQNIKMQSDLKTLGISQDAMTQLQTPLTLDIEQVSNTENAKTESEMMMAYVFVYALLFLLYTGVLGYGNMVAMDISGEKSSRVMEIMISTVSPLKQMFGKIIGICLVGLLQMLTFIIVAGANLSIPQNKRIIQDLGFNVSDISPSLLIYFIIFFIGGYFLYATLFAAVGSLVSKTEEVGQAIMPITFLIIAGFMTAMFGLTNPNATFIVIMSYIPFFTPMIMFLRIGMATPAFWEIAASIIVLFLSILGMGWLAARVYRTGVLLYGKRLSIKELRHAMKSLQVSK